MPPGLDIKFPEPERGCPCGVGFDLFRSDDGAISVSDDGDSLEADDSPASDSSQSSASGSTHSMGSADEPLINTTANYPRRCVRLGEHRATTGNKSPPGGRPVFGTNVLRRVRREGGGYSRAGRGVFTIVTTVPTGVSPVPVPTGVPHPVGPST